MDYEIIFRIVFIGLYAFIFIFRMVYAIIAKISGRKIMPDKEAYKNEGKFIINLRYFAAPAWLTVITLYVIYPDWLRFLSIPIPVWLRWIGAGLGVLASLFFLRVQHILGRYWSGQLNLRQDHILIKNGPYKYIRHPMYSAILLFLLSSSIISAFYLILIPSLIAAILLLIRIPQEERMLVARFGKEYQTYKKQTGYLWPKFIK